MTVIAMTQEMGSLAKEVALELASTMNLSVLRKEVVEHVASKMHVRSSLINRLREGKAGFVERLTTDKERVALFSAEEVFELANRGDVVIRGWGATCLLRPIPNIVCVRIVRSFAKRVDWLMDYLQTDDREVAESEIRRSDSAHASRMHEQFGVTWGDPLLYDMVLNTDRISVGACAEQIRLLCNRPEFKLTQESHQLLSDMTLAARIRAALKVHETTQNVNITIDCLNGEVNLRGIVVTMQERSDAEKIALQVAGVTHVSNELRLMANSRLFPSAKY
ncbi:MAG: cytidylate kinase family protein [Polaromonas sp.]